MMLGFGPYLYLAVPGLLLGIYAQLKLMSTYNRYIQVPNERGLTGAQAAREVLDAAGLHGMPVEEVAGQLTDHYDPTKKALFLSSENYHGRSIAAIGVAAHEAGHALQHKAAYTWLQLRMMMVPATQIATNATFIIFLISMFTGFLPLILLKIAIGAFAVVAFFNLVTLPVEYDASRRAKEQLFALGLVGSHERGGVAKVLNAAALTYVAALVTAVLTLLRLMLMARDRD
jgi:uncharacterized protein